MHHTSPAYSLAWKQEEQKGGSGSAGWEGTQQEELGGRSVPPPAELDLTDRRGLAPLLHESDFSSNSSWDPVSGGLGQVPGYGTFRSNLLDGLMAATIRHALHSSSSSLVPPSPSYSQEHGHALMPSMSATTFTPPKNVSATNTASEPSSARSTVHQPVAYPSGPIQFGFSPAVSYMDSGEGQREATTRAFETVLQLVEKMLPGFLSGQPAPHSAGVRKPSNRNSSIGRSVELMCPIQEAVAVEGSLFSPCPGGLSPVFDRETGAQHAEGGDPWRAPWEEEEEEEEEEGAEDGKKEAPWEEEEKEEEAAEEKGGKKEAPKVEEAGKPKAMEQSHSKVVNMQVYSDDVADLATKQVAVLAEEGPALNPAATPPPPSLHGSKGHTNSPLTDGMMQSHGRPEASKHQHGAGSQQASMLQRIFRGCFAK